MDLQIEARGPLVTPWAEKLEIRVKGTGLAKPRSGSACKIMVLDVDPPTHTVTRVGDESEVVIGDSDDVLRFLIDTCLQTMIDAEVSVFRFDTSHFRSLVGDASSDSGVKCQVVLKLISFVPVPSWGARTKAELSEILLDLKSRGVTLYSQRRTYLSLRRFSEAVQLACILESLKLDGEERLSLCEVKAQLYSNIAAIFLSAGVRDEWAFELCRRGLVLDPENVKLLYRRGWANARLQNFDCAIADLERVLDLDPSNGAALSRLAHIKAQKRADDVRLGNALKKLFGSRQSAT